MRVVAKTIHGEVAGREEAGVMAFKGIPYAAPPFGANRFLAPARPDSWTGVRDALEFGPTAPHPPYRAPLDQVLPEPVIAGSDCLNLNVWTPDAGAAGLPVMVWIHGGAFTNGSSAVPAYAGDRFARDGVVCVTINYRLGTDGFLFLDDAVSNRGLLDQIAALEWVQENISRFGGDPSNVTVFGESAGAMSVATLLSMPRARGLFRRAIAQSGAAHHVLPVETARLVTDELATRLGVPATRAGIAGVGLDQLVATQQRLASDIASTTDRPFWREIAFNAMPFEPVLDGDVLDVMPFQAIEAGAGHDVEIVTGTNHDEHRLFLLLNGAIDVVDDSILRFAAGAHGLDDARLAAYLDPSLSPGETLSAVLTDWFFRMPAIRLAEAHGAPTFVYEFAWGSPLYDGRLGACHAIEIEFVFDTLDEAGAAPMCGAEPPHALADTMHRAWVDFAATGDPGWPAYVPETRATMTFDAMSEVVNDPRRAQRLAWEGVR